MRARLEDAEGRAARWARRAGVAETPLPPLPLGRADFGAGPLLAVCTELLSLE